MHALPPSQFDKETNQDKEDSNKVAQNDTGQTLRLGKGMVDDVDKEEEELNELKKKLDNTITQLNQTKKVTNQV